MSLNAERQFLRQLISLKDNVANVDNSLRTNHLDEFIGRSAVAETNDFFKGQCSNLDDSLRTNHLDNFRHRSTIAVTTDFLTGQY